MSKEKKKELSAQQREFCRLVVSGASNRQAYAQAFGCKLDSASASATKLLKKAYIQTEISRLREKGRDRERKRDDRALWSKAERMERLQEWAERSAEAGEINAAVRCVDVLNKMDGAYEPQKVEVSTDADMLRAILSRTNAEPMVRASSDNATI